MASWQETINISHLHRLYSDGKIKVMQLGKAVAARLKTTSYFKSCEPEMIDIIAEFGSLDEFSDHKDYITALDLLYDFGDIENRLWVETIRPDADEDDTTPAIINKPVKVYSDFASEDTKPEFKGPYYQNHPNIRVLGGSSDDSPTSTKRYNRTKTVRYLSETDFNKRLADRGIDPEKIAKDMYSYMKDADDDYQDWLINRWKEIVSSSPISPKSI